MLRDYIPKYFATSYILMLFILTHVMDTNIIKF